MKTRYEASTAEADEARVTLEVRRFDGLPAMVRIQSDGREHVATLAVDDVDDIFGVGRSASEAVTDLIAALHETRRHLETNSVPLSSRLQRQAQALKSLLPDKTGVLKADTNVRRKSYPRQEGSNLGRYPAFRRAAAS